MVARNGEGCGPHRARRRDREVGGRRQESGEQAHIGLLDRIGLKRLAATLLLAASLPALAQQSYPSRSIRLIVDTSPGGLTDILARMAAEGLARELGKQVVVENKAGAAGNMAIEYVMKSPADGYTLMICAGGNVVIKPFLDHSFAFDPLSDLVPVFNVAEAPHILVVPDSVPAKNLAEFIAWAKANPGKLYYGSAGN